MSKDRILVVVVGWNNKDLLPTCLDSLKNQTYKKHKVVYVDNASEDGSSEYVEENYKDVVVIKNSENEGFAAANNTAIEQEMDESVKLVALINTDATLDENFFDRIIEFSNLKPNGACFQGTTLDYFNRTIIDSTHIYIARNGGAIQGSWRKYYIGEKGPKKVFGVNAAAAVYSAEFINTQKNNKLFDESLFMYLEDVDVALRTTVGGWDNYLVPGAIAYHMGSASSKKKSSTFSLYYTYRNNIAVLIKNLPFSILIKILPRALKSDYLTIKHLIKIKQADSIPALVKGRLVGLLRTPIYLGKRSKGQLKISKRYLWNLMVKGF